MTKGSKSEVVELIQLPDEEDSRQANQNSCRSIGRGNMDQIKTLILFEDVDATLSEDHGFLSTIQQLAQTAKRPMILTSNSKRGFGFFFRVSESFFFFFFFCLIHLNNFSECNPVLPNNLDRLEVLFKMPSLEELISLGRMVRIIDKYF